jgi:manganese/zinc/iron transport system permease protein
MTAFMLIIWTLLIAIVTAITCSLCGVLLVVKREAFISEGLSHAILPGIVLGFLVVPDRASPLLIVSAGLSGMVMVWIVQLIANTRLVHRDAALGIVFSALFSIGIVITSLKLKNVHFHADCIIDGNLAQAALDQVTIGGIDLGPKSFFTMLIVLLIVCVFVFVFYKELKLMTFDEASAQMFGFRPKMLHTVWLLLVSVTAVAAFETAGTVLVVALMIAPAAAANILTQRLSWMFIISAVLGALSAVFGIFAAKEMNISPAGPIATFSGLSFVFAVCITGLNNRRSGRHSEVAVDLPPVGASADTYISDTTDRQSR